VVINNSKKAVKKCTAYNERFCESGGVCPPEHLCEFASAPPAQAFVNPRPRKAASPLYASLGGQCQKMQKTKELIEPITISKTGQDTCKAARVGKIKNIYTMKRVFFLTSVILMSLVFNLNAQDTQKEAESAKTKMDIFSSKTGVIVKFIDTKLPNLSALYTSAETRIRKVKSGNTAPDFYQIEK
jgi:hypothetical protein